MNVFPYIKKSFFCVIIFIMFSGCAGTTRSLYERMEPGYKWFTSTEIPLQFEKGMPYITIRTQNKAIDLSLDTGASSVTIGLTPEDIKGLDKEDVGDSTGMFSNYGSSIYKRFLLPKVKIGALTYYSLVCDEDNIPTEGFTQKGTIGLALLKEFNVLIDFKEAKIVLYRKDIYPNQDDVTTWQKISFINHNDGIMLKGKFQGSDRELIFILDTCAIAWIDSDSGKAANIMKGSSFAKIKGVPSEEESGYKVVSSQDLIVAGEVIHSLNFIFMDQITQPSSVDGGFLGNDFLLKYKVFIDFGKTMMYIKRQV